MIDNTLHRCLHCGGKAKLVSNTDITAAGLIEHHKVVCEDCGCGTPNCRSAGEAVVKWQAVYTGDRELESTR